MSARPAVVSDILAFETQPDRDEDLILCNVWWQQDNTDRSEKYMVFKAKNVTAGTLRPHHSRRSLGNLMLLQATPNMWCQFSYNIATTNSISKMLKVNFHYVIINDELRSDLYMFRR
jgi:hypothetical protein